MQKRESETDESLIEREKARETSISSRIERERESE